MFISSQATRAGLWLNKQRTGYAMKDFVVKEKSPGRASVCQSGTGQSHCR